MTNRIQNKKLTTFARVVLLIALYFVGGLIGKETTSLARAGKQLVHSTVVVQVNTVKNILHDPDVLVWDIQAYLCDISCRV